MKSNTDEGRSRGIHAHGTLHKRSSRRMNAQSLSCAHAVDRPFLQRICNKGHYKFAKRVSAHGATNGASNHLISDGGSALVSSLQTPDAQMLHGQIPRGAAGMQTTTSHQPSVSILTTDNQTTSGALVRQFPASATGNLTLNAFHKFTLGVGTVSSSAKMALGALTANEDSPFCSPTGYAAAAESARIRASFQTSSMDDVGGQSDNSSSTVFPMGIVRHLEGCSIGMQYRQAGGKERSAQLDASMLDVTPTWKDERGATLALCQLIHERRKAILLNSNTEAARAFRIEFLSDKRSPGFKEALCQLATLSMAQAAPPSAA